METLTYSVYSGHEDLSLPKDEQVHEQSIICTGDLNEATNYFEKILETGKTKIDETKCIRYFVYILRNCNYKKNVIQYEEYSSKKYLDWKHEIYLKKLKGKENETSKK